MAANVIAKITATTPPSSFVKERAPRTIARCATAGLKNSRKRARNENMTEPRPLMGRFTLRNICSNSLKRGAAFLLKLEVLSIL
jgi:hypothetical protein